MKWLRPKYELHCGLLAVVRPLRVEGTQQQYQQSSMRHVAWQRSCKRHSGTVTQRHGDAVE